MFQVGLAFDRIGIVVKPFLACLILFGVTSYAQVDGDGGDPNLRPGGYSGIAQGAGTKINCPECDSADNKRYKEVKDQAQSIEDAAAANDAFTGFDDKQKEANLKKALNSRSGYSLPPDAAKISPEEMETKRRKAITENLNVKDGDGDSEKVKKGLDLREGISSGQTSIGGVDIEAKVAPTKGGAKFKIKGKWK